MEIRLDQIKVELDDTQITEIVVEDLKDSYRTLQSFVITDDECEDKRIMDALDIVLDYYQTYEENLSWEKEKAEFGNLEEEPENNDGKEERTDGRPIEEAGNL